MDSFSGLSKQPDVEAVNQGLFVSLVVTAIIAAVTTFFDARRLIRAA